MLWNIFFLLFKKSPKQSWAHRLGTWTQNIEYNVAKIFGKASKWYTLNINISLVNFTHCRIFPKLSHIGKNCPQEGESSRPTDLTLLFQGHCMMQSVHDILLGQSVNRIALGHITDPLSDLPAILDFKQVFVNPQVSYFDFVNEIEVEKI